MVYQSGKYGTAVKSRPNISFSGSTGTKVRAPLEGGGTAVTYGSSEGSSESGQLGQAETVIVPSFQQRQEGVAQQQAERKVAEEAKQPVFSEQSLYASRNSFQVTPVKRFYEEEKIKGFESPFEKKSFSAGKGYYPEERVSQYERERSGEQARARALQSKPTIKIGTYEDFAAEAHFALQQTLATEQEWYADLWASKILKYPEQKFGWKPNIDISQNWGNFTISSEFKSQNLLGKASDVMGFGFGRAYEAITLRPVSTAGAIAPFILLDIGTMGLGKVARTGIGLLTIGGVGAYKEIKEPGSVLSGWGALETATEFATFAVPIKVAGFGLQKLNTYSLNVRQKAYQRAVEDTVIIKIPQKTKTFSYSKDFTPSETELRIPTESEIISNNNQISVVKLEAPKALEKPSTISTTSFIKQLSKNNPFKTMGTAAGADTSLIGENFLSSKLKFLGGSSNSILVGNLNSINDIFTGAKRRAQVQAQQQKAIYKGFDFEQGIKLKQETKQKTKQVAVPFTLSKTIQKQFTRQKQKQFQIVKQKSSQMQIPKLFQEQNQVQNQIQQQNQIQRQIQKQIQRPLQIEQQITIPKQEKTNIAYALWYPKGRSNKISYKGGFNLNTSFKTLKIPTLDVSLGFVKLKTKYPKYITGLESRPFPFKRKAKRR